MQFDAVEAGLLGALGGDAEFPALDLAIVEEAGGAEIGAGGDRAADAFDDQQPVPGGALAIEVGHHRAGNVARLDGAQAGHRREGDAMAQRVVAELDGSEEFGHDGVLHLFAGLGKRKHCLTLLYAFRKSRRSRAIG